ncbi:MAG: DNA polymerase III subunit [Bacteroidia bacterium]|nr:DNA polymerase III subunit [Bacteroidia bacterium]
MLFKELAISAHINERIVSLNKTGKIPHAILFPASEGTGNLAVAIAFAQYILCDNPSELDSCGACPHCIKSRAYMHPDIFYSFPFVGSKDKELSTFFLEEWRKLLNQTPYPTIRDWQEYLDSKNKQLNIYISEIRNIAKRLSLKSYSGKKKILILWLPEYLGKEGNILLKLIEEPPDNTLFFLVTEDENSILRTIISRTQRIYIPKPDSEDIANYLISINNELSFEKASSIALASKGNVNAAIAMLNEIQEPFFDNFRNWLLACFKGRYSEIIASIEQINSGSRDFVINFLNYGLEIMREVFLYQHQGRIDKMSRKENEFLSNFAKTMEGRTFDAIYSQFNNTIFGIERNGNIKLLLTNLSMELNKIFKGKEINKAVYGLQ